MRKRPVDLRHPVNEEGLSQCWGPRRYRSCRAVKCSVGQSFTGGRLLLCACTWVCPWGMSVNVYGYEHAEAGGGQCGCLLSLSTSLTESRLSSEPQKSSSPVSASPVAGSLGLQVYSTIHDLKKLFSFIQVPCALNFLHFYCYTWANIRARTHMDAHS